MENKVNFTENNHNFSSLSDLLDFVGRNCEEISEDTLHNLMDNIKILLKKQISHSDSSCVNVKIKQLLTDWQYDGRFKIWLQIMYQILKCTQETEYKHNMNCNIMDNSLVFFLISILFQRLCQDEILLLTKMMTLIRMYIEIFDTEAKPILKSLWSECKLNHKKVKIWPVITEFYEQFLEIDILVDISFYEILLKLISSNLREDRKAAYFLMNFCLKNFERTTLAEGINKNEWVNIIVVLENLEENQSHLILPALENFEQVHEHKLRFGNNIINEWYKVILNKILSSSNILIKKWAVGFFMRIFTWKYLVNNNMEMLFLEMLNTTKLYSALTLNQEYISFSNIEILTNENLINFFEAYDGFVDIDFLKHISLINWKPIPLNFWLKKMLGLNFSYEKVDFATILKIASSVRRLQNVIIRKESLKIIYELFFHNLTSLNIKEFCIFIDTSCNSRLDFIEEFEQLFNSHIENFLNSKYLEDFYFPKNFCSILNIKCLNFLKSLAIKNYGYMIFNILYYYFDNVEHRKYLGDLMQRKFCVDLTVISAKNFNDFKAILAKTISSTYPYIEASYIEEECSKFYILENLRTFSDFARIDWNPIDILEMLNKDIMGRFIILTISMLSTCSDENIILFIENIKFESLEDVKYFGQAISDYKNIPENVLKAAYFKILQFFKPSLKLSNFKNYSGVYNFDLIIFYIEQMVLLDDHHFGDSKIENEYIIYCHYKTDGYVASYDKLELIFSIHPKNDYPKLIEHLLKVFISISKRKPRYFNNSFEHVMHTRLVNFLFYLKNKNLLVWQNEFWEIILNQNHQINITVCLEYLIASFITDTSQFLEKFENLNQYSTSKQVSILTIKFFSFLTQVKVRTTKAHQIKSFIASLLPLTIGSNFLIRFYAQLYVYNLTKTLDPADNDSFLSEFANSIEKANNKENLINDLRLMIIKLSDKDPLEHIIHYCTNAPINEYSINAIKSIYNLKDFRKIKATYEKKSIKSKTKEVAVTTNDSIFDYDITRNFNIQRKNQTFNKFLSPYEKNQPYLKSVSGMENVYLVTSLIDKFANLGGLARSCEVFGINNFIVNCKQVVESLEFQTLSLTAEKHLNLIEVKKTDLRNFFVEKQFEGYQLVGAEQVSKSCNFNGFTFPKKCIIVLGNEKEGIPANLLSLLDFTVEIPQIGNVRSLNVHVTGALFMWEYMKQHML